MSSTTIAGSQAPVAVEQQIRGGNRVQVDISLTSIAKVLFVVALFGLGYYVLRELSTLLIQFSIACFLAIAADPLVRKLEARSVGRGKSIVTVMLGVVLVVGAMLAIFVPPLVHQGNKLAKATPHLVTETRDSRLFHRMDEKYDVVDKASKQAEKLPGIVSDQLGTVVSAVLAGVVGTITILFLTLFLLAGGGNVARGTVQVFPKLIERRWWSVIEGAYTGISAYVGGAIIIALIGGSTLALTCFILQLPYALPLGLWMMLLEIIPLIGATIGAIPAIIVAFIAGGVWQGLVMVAFIIIYQQFENIVIQPRVQGRAASLSPLIVFLSVLVGSQLLGVLGALFAIPIAGVFQIIIRQLIEQQGSHELAMPALIAGGEASAKYVDQEMQEARHAESDSDSDSDSDD
jgi:predicted PurR-regulated permease PerM